MIRSRRTSGTIQNRLALASTVSLGVTGCLVLAGSFLFLRQRLSEDLRTFAFHEAEEVATATAEARTQAEILAHRPAFNGLFPEKDVLAVEVWSLDGKCVFALPEPADTRERWEVGLLESARGERPTLKFTTPDGVPALRTARLVRYGMERRSGLDPARAAAVTGLRVGRPIAITSVMLMAGFLVVALSGFATLRQFGVLSAATMGICLLTDLVLLPALLIRARA